MKFLTFLLFANTCLSMETSQQDPCRNRGLSLAERRNKINLSVQKPIASKYENGECQTPLLPPKKKIIPLKTLLSLTLL